MIISDEDWIAIGWMIQDPNMEVLSFHEQIIKLLLELYVIYLLEVASFILSYPNSSICKS